MFIRRKVAKGETYYQAVEGYRDEQGRVRHRTVASLGRSATPDEAVVVARKNLRRLQTRLAKFEPSARYSKQFGRRVDGLRSRMARLTQQLKRLQTLRDRAKGWHNSTPVAFASWSQHPGQPDEPGGPEARAYLQQLVEGETVVCRLTNERTHGRRVGWCRHRGQDLGEALVRAGLARDYARFSGGAYAGAAERKRPVRENRWRPAPPERNPISKHGSSRPPQSRNGFLRAGWVRKGERRGAPAPGPNAPVR
jgi:hypothetical protein